MVWKQFYSSNIPNTVTLQKRRKPQTFVYNIFLTFDAAKFKIANFPSRYLKFRGQIYDNSQISLTQNKAEKIPKKK